MTILISKVPGRALRLAYQNNRLVRAPSMPRRLKEAAPREGFFEREQFLAVRKHLPADLAAAVTISYTFGWRMRSEVLTLQRRHLDLRASTLRLDPGTTKNDEGLDGRVENDARRAVRRFEPTPARRPRPRPRPAASEARGPACFYRRENVAAVSKSVLAGTPR